MQDVFSVITAGQAVVTEAFRPLLKKSTDARIIFISSSVGLITLRCDSTNKSYRGSAIAYRVSKAGLDMLAARYAKELGEEFGCKVWALDPGLVQRIEGSRCTRTYHKCNGYLRRLHGQA
jgi:NAD(P)-dependent dehydrogenase (short-subunit alcohol dehydrogenase family)